MSLQRLEAVILFAKGFKAYPILVLLVSVALGFDSSLGVVSIISDAAFISGAIFIAIFIIGFCQEKGLFDMLIFGVKRFLSVFNPSLEGDYYSYKHGKIRAHADKRLLLSGGVLMVLSLVLCFFC